MKRFLSTFLVCLVLLWAFMFFGGAMIFENSWALLAFLALVLTVLVLLFGSISDQMDEMEKRIKALEEQLGPETPLETEERQ